MNKWGKKLSNFLLEQHENLYDFHIITNDCRNVYLDEILQSESLSRATYKFLTRPYKTLDLKTLDVMNNKNNT